MQVITETPILGISLGGPEMMILVFLVLLLFGAKKLPQLARGLGRSASEFRRGKEEFERELMDADKPRDRDKV